MKKFNLPTAYCKRPTAYCLLLTVLLLFSSTIMAATLIDEKFSSWPPAGWQIIDHSGNGAWTNHYAIHDWTSYIHKGDYPTNHNDTAAADAKHVNDATNPPVLFNTSLITPPLDLSDASYIVLYYDTVFFYSEYCSNYANVAVSTNNGASWVTALNWTGESHQKYGPGTNITVNISVAGGCSNALVRFHYYSSEDYYWEIDNVEIVVGTINPTDFDAKGVAENQIDLSWMTNEVGDEIIIARNISDSFGTPADGTVYNVSDNIGSSFVIYKGDEIGHSDSNLISEATEYFYKIWSVNSSTQYSEGVTAKAVSCVGTFPYMESFETDYGVWHNIEDCEHDWTRRSGTTPTFNTGPDGGANGSAYYIYTEASPPGSPDKTFLIEASFDFSESLNPELEFFYHMYGEEMGSLHIDVLDDSGAWHTNLWEKIGEQQTSSSAPWKSAIVDLQKFGEQSPLKVRFRGITAGLYYGDMAVDYITITNRPNNLFFTPKASNSSGHPGTTVQYNITALNLTTTNLDFNLTYSGFGGGTGWNETGPANTGLLIFRDSTNFTLNVTIDPNAAAEEAHTSVITSVSVDGVFTNSTEIITKCDWHYEIYSESFNVEKYHTNGWPNGWTNYFLGQTNNLGWFHGIERYLMLWAPAHDPAYGATNWFVSPAIDFSSGFDQIYLSFFFLHYSDPYVPMDHKQSVYVSSGSRNPNDGDYVKAADIDYGGNASWLYNLFDLSAFHGHSNVYIAIDYTSGNPMIAFDVVNIEGNKTGVKNAKLDSPTSFSLDAYQTAPAVTGSIYIAGSTGTSGPAAQVTAQFGYGLKNTVPFDNINWKWVDAVYSHSDDTHDYYVCGTAFPTVSGEMDCAFRFKNGFSSWIYADTNGSSNGYSKAAAGEMTVNMLPPIGELVKEQTMPKYIINAYTSVDNTLYDYAFADDFQFSSDTDINSIRWNAIYWGTGRTGYETGIVVKIYQNNPSGGGLPGAELYSEFIPGYSCEQVVKKDATYDININKYHIDLTTTFEAAANTKYWFSVQMQVPVQNESWGQIITSDPVSGQYGAQSDHGVWSLKDSDFGFALYGTQSPLLTAPVTQDFGSVELYMTSSVPLIVGNAGGGVLTGAVQNIFSPFFISGEINYFIPASSNIMLNTFFVPEAEGDFSQSVQLTGGGGKTVVFTGNAIPEPALFLILNFGFLILCIIKRQASNVNL